MSPSYVRGYPWLYLLYLLCAALLQPNLQSAEVAPPDPFMISPAPLAENEVNYDLPFGVDDVCTGAGGRFLIFYSAQARKFAIFDVNVAKVVAQIPAASEQVVFTAGADALFVVLVPENVIQRWSLATFKREASMTMKLSPPIQAIGAGAASKGPLVVVHNHAPYCALAVLDSKTLETQDWGREEPRMRGDSINDPEHDLRMRGSLDGGLFVIWQAGQGSGDGVKSIFCRNRKIGFLEEHSRDRAIRTHAVPSPDGRRVYCGSEILSSHPVFRGGIVTDRIGLPERKFLVPAVHGNAYFSIPYALEGKPLNLAVGLHFAGDDRRLAEIPGVEVPVLPADWDWKDEPRLTLDKRVWLIPAAKLLVQVVAASKTLALHRVDVDKLLSTCNTDYLFVDSQPAKTGYRGKSYEYLLQVKAKKAPVKFALASGPTGMSVSPAGMVTWKLPAEDRCAQVDCVVSVTDGAGQERFQSWQLAIEDAVEGDKTAVVEEETQQVDKVPYVANPPVFSKFRSPLFDQEKLEIPLPGVVTDAALGAGGRYLLLFFEGLKQVAVFDVEGAKIVKTIPAHDLHVFIAAGAEDFAIAFEDQKVAISYRFPALERETVKATPSGLHTTQFAAGAASKGPLYRLGWDFGKRTAEGLDLRTLQQTSVKITGASSVLADQDHVVGASPDGSIFFGASTYLHEWGAFAIAEEGEARRVAGAGYENNVKKVPQTREDLCVRAIARLPPNVAGSELLIPDLAGEFFLSFTPQEYVAGKLKLRILGDSRVIKELDGIVPCANDFDRYTALAKTTLPTFKRTWFISQVNLLLTLPEQSEEEAKQAERDLAGTVGPERVPLGRLILQQVNVQNALNETDVDYLAVTSQAPPKATRGQLYRYDLKVLSKKGDLQFERTAGADEMKISPKGELEWQVPKKFKEDHLDVIISVKDASEQEVLHKFTLAITKDPVLVIDAARPAAMRQWVDESGKFRVKGQFLEVTADGNVRLKKENGAVITVPLKRLSEVDREYVTQQTKSK